MIGSDGTTSVGAGALLPVLQRHARFIVWNVAATTLLSIALSFALPKWYKARAVLLPPAEEETSLGLSQLIPRGLGGIKLPGAPTLSDLFLSVLKSRSVAERLVDRFDLVRRYRKRDVEKALKELGTHTRFQIGDEGTISISVEDRDAKVSAAMANAYVEELDRFNRLTRTTSARRTREFIQERLEIVQKDLAAAEDRLRDYQQQKGLVVLSPEARGEAEVGARLVAQKIALEVKLNVLRRSLAESSQEVRRSREELAAVERQLGSMPQAGVETMRLWRDLKVQEQLYELLTAQLEEARIRETRDTPTVQILDPAAPPLHKSRPKRLLVALAGFLLGVFVSSGVLLLKERSIA